MLHFTKVKDSDLYICEFLDDTSLSRLRRTSKYFNVLLEDPSFWRRKCLYNLKDCDISILKCELDDSYTYYKETILGTIKTFKRWKESWHLSSNSRTSSLTKEVHKTVCHKYALEQRVDLLTLMETCDLHDIIEAAVDGDYWKNWPMHESCLVVNAVLSGSIHVLDWLYIRGYLSELTYAKYLPWVAMRSGNISMLDWLKQNLNVVPLNYTEVITNYSELTKHQESRNLRIDIKSMSWTVLEAVLRWLLTHKQTYATLVDLCGMLLGSNHFENVVLWCLKNNVKFDMYVSIIGSDKDVYDVTEILRRFDILYKHGYRPHNPVVLGLTCFVLTIGLAYKNIALTGETYDYDYNHIIDWMVSKQLFIRK